MDELDMILDLPVICTRGILVFPEHEISIDVGRSFSLKAIERSVGEHDENIVLISQVNPMDEKTDYDHVFHHGTICKVVRRIKKDNHGTIKLTVKGIKRVELLSLYENVVFS